MTELWKGYSKTLDSFLEYSQKYLDEMLPSSTLGEAVKYAFFGGGKRLRPLMLLEVCNALNYSDEYALRAALAIELVHCYSLVHDDLPCMDNDDFRRGQPCVHKKYGEAMAVLCGDAMLNLAYEVLCEDISAVSHINAMKIISFFAGIGGMVGGQELDINPVLADAPKEIQEKYLYQMYLKKTAALFRAAVGAGAALGGADAKEAEALDDFATDFGLAFQLADDLHDDGKEEEKLTYLKLNGAEKTKALAKHYLEAAIKALEPYGEKYQNLAALCATMLAKYK